MTTNNSLTARYFSLLARPLRGSLISSLWDRLSEIIRSSHSYGYEKRKACPELSRRELRPDYQTLILAYQPNPLITS